MRNISYHGQINLDNKLTEEEVEFGSLGRPQISILADGDYEIYASVDSPGKLIKMFDDRTLSGNQMLAWNFDAANEIQYLMIRMISGTYIKADIRVSLWGHIN